MEVAIDCMYEPGWGELVSGAVFGIGIAATLTVFLGILALTAWWRLK